METLTSGRPQDPLYVVFEEHLHSGLYDEQTTDIFVRDVVDFYYHKLVKEGYIPHRMQDLVKADLTQEVKDMLRSKTYGHRGIADYNRARKK
jgi:hypothetical protein